MATLTPTTFAKLFTVDGWQVLFYVEPHGDEGKLHQIICDKEVAAVDVVLGFDNQDKAWDAFDKIDDDYARRAVQKMTGILQQMAD